MISVIIVNHNYGQFIGTAIESILQQTYRDFEIVIVDGASSDNSRNVILKYAHEYPEKITVIFRDESGQAAGFNVGFSNSKGEIIAFLDADDFFMPNKLECVAQEMKRCEFLGNARRHFGDVADKDYIAKQDLNPERRALFREYGYVYSYNLITSCLSAKRSLLEKILPMPEEHYMTHADMYLKLMAQYYSDITYIPKVLTGYRIHNRQKNHEFISPTDSSVFLEKLYEQVYIDMNLVLQNRGEDTVPLPNEKLITKAFCLANPSLDIKEGSNYAIYGGGVNSYRIFKILTALHANVGLIADSDERKWGTKWNDCKIVSPDELVERRKEYEFVLIGSFGYYGEIAARLNQLGLKEGIDYFLPMSISNE